MTDLAPCPLCRSPEVKSYQVGWAVIWCRKCGVSLSKAMKLKDLIAIWNERGEQPGLFEGKANG